MKCTQEQFESIKHLLIDSVEWLDEFSICPYLVNSLGCNFGVISNVTQYGANDKDYNREVHEEWNAQIFLEACGIETNNICKHDIYKEIGVLLDKAKEQGVKLKITIEQ